MADGPDHRAVRGEAVDLSAYLTELKQQGSALLVTGDVSGTTRAYVSQQFMGETGIYPVRRRILIDIGREKRDLNQYLPTSVSPASQYVRIIHVQGRARSTVDFPSTDIGSDDRLDVLQDEVVDVLSEFKEQCDHTLAGVIRLGITSMLPLMHKHGNDAAVELCQSLSSKIKSSRGMAHYHLPVRSDDPLVDTIAGTVDAHIELRERDHLVEHRWDILDEEFKGKTDWIAL